MPNTRRPLNVHARRQRRLPLIELAVWKSPPVKAGGDLAGPLAKFIMDPRHDARAEELDNLKLALATFALQLEAFELRAREGLLAAGIEPGTAVARPDGGAGPGGKIDWSIGSVGSKWDA